MRFPAYPDYKPSGVAWLGEVPGHWEIRKLKFTAGCRVSNVDKKSVEGNEPVKLCNYVDVYYRERIDSDVAFMEATATAGQIERFSLKVGDVMITKDSETPDDIAVPAVVSEKLDGVVCGYHLALLRPMAEQVDGGFLARALSATGVRDHFWSSATGITRFGLTLNDIGTAPIPRPPLSEQRAIAAFLDRETARIDALIAKKQRLIELLQEKRAALISHAVTRGLNPAAALKDSGIPWLGQIPAHWEVKPVKFIATIGNGSTPSRENPDYWLDGSYPWLNSSVVNQESVTVATEFVTETALAECHLPIIKPPALLVGITGQGRTRGMATTLMIEATINQHVACVKPRGGKVDVAYLRRVFDRAYSFLRNESDGGGSTKGAITCEQIANLKVPLPPLAEQSAIAALADRETDTTEMLAQKVKTAIAKLTEYRASLIAHAVTGKIDVRNVLPAETPETA